MKGRRVASWWDRVIGNDNDDDVSDDDDDDEFVKHKIKSQMCHNIELTLKVYSFCANVCFIN